MARSVHDLRDVKADLAVVGGVLATTYLLALAGHGLANGPAASRALVLLALPFTALLAWSAATWSRRALPRSGAELVALFVLWPFLYQGATGAVMLEPHRYVDPWLAALDSRLLGHPPGPPPWPLGGPVEELANLFYVSFYAVVPGALLWLWHRRGPEPALRGALAFLAAFTACGAAWLLLPAGGYHLSGSPDGAPFGPFTALARFMYGQSPHYAAAFPSSHVALAVTSAGALVLAGGSRVWLLWVAGVCFATVYGQYHYAVDVPPGLLVGAAAVSLAWRAEPVTAWVRRGLAGARLPLPSPVLGRERDRDSTSRRH